MKRYLFAAISPLLFASPAMALTLEQAQNELAGMTCSGSSCSSSTTVTTAVQNPDIVTERQVLVSPATSEAATQPDQSSPAEDYASGGWFNARCGGIGYYNADCTALSIAPTSGGTGAVYRTETIVTPGGTSTVVTCVTTTKTLTYNGPHTSRNGAWSVDSSSSESSGAC